MLAGLIRNDPAAGLMLNKIMSESERLGTDLNGRVREFTVRNSRRTLKNSKLPKIR